MGAAETWKPVVGYEGLYEVSDLGRVRCLVLRTRYGCRALDAPRILNPTAANNGYVGLTLTKAGIKHRHSVHRLVLIAFRGPPPVGMEGAHLNNDRADPRLENLEWKTRSDNHADKLRHGTAQRGEACGKSKLTWAQVEEIRRRYRRRCFKNGSGALARQFGVSAATILCIVRGETWNAVDEREAA